MPKFHFVTLLGWLRYVPPLLYMIYAMFGIWMNLVYSFVWPQLFLLVCFRVSNGNNWNWIGKVERSSINRFPILNSAGFEINDPGKESTEYQLETTKKRLRLSWEQKYSNLSSGWISTRRSAIYWKEFSSNIHIREASLYPEFFNYIYLKPSIIL